MTAGSGAPGGGAPGAVAGLGLGTGGYGGSVAPSPYGQGRSTTTSQGRGQTTSQGRGQTSFGPMGFNTGNVSSLGQSTSSTPSSTPSPTPVQNANQNAQNANAPTTIYGLSNQGQTVAQPTSVLGSTTATSQGMGFMVPSVNAVTSSTLGVPVTTSEGVPVQHGNLSGKVAGTTVIPSDVVTAETMNTLGDMAGPLGDFGLPPITPLPPSVMSVPSAILGFFAEAAQAQTPQNVANTRAALALSPPSQSPFGGTTDSSYAHPMGLNTTSRPNTPSYGTVNRAEPAREQLVQAIASASPRDPDPVTGIAPLPTPVATGVIDTILQNALAKLQPTQQVQSATSNRVFNPQIQKIIQQFRDQALA
jgi:hypothetical protein